MEAIEVNLLDKTQKLIGEEKDEKSHCVTANQFGILPSMPNSVPLLVSEAYVSLFKILFSHPGIN